MAQIFFNEVSVVEALFIVVFIGVIALFIKLGVAGSNNGPSLPKSPPEQFSPQKPRAKVTKAQPSRFDTESAKHLHDKRVLTGAAYVTDGDTIKIKKTQVRLFGIDAPELNHPFGNKAKWALVKLCKGHSVRAEIIDIDDHGRTVAHCYLPDGRDLSAEMVKQGLAIDWPKFSGGKYKDLETADARKKLFLADARQKGRMHVWKKFEEKQNNS